MKTILFLIASSIIIISCENDKDRYLILQGQIMEINGPDTALVNELISIEIVFNGGTDGCATPSHLETTQTDTIITIKAFYSYPNFPTICPQYIPTHKLILDITPANAAHYLLEAEDDLKIMDTIVVTL